MAAVRDRSTIARISRLHAQRNPVTNARLKYLFKLALQHDEIELAAAAAVVSATPGIDDTLRRKLWLRIAQGLVQQNKSIKNARESSLPQTKQSVPNRRLLSPFYRYFAVVDDCKEDICAALAD